MRLMQIKLEAKNNVISFQNQYLKGCFLGKGIISGNKRDKFNVRIISQAHPQLDVYIDDYGKPNVVDIYLQGTDLVPDYVWNTGTRTKEVDLIVGKVLMSLALFDLKNSIPEIDGTERLSELILNGTRYEIDLSKQIEIARFLLGNEL
jgi:hypothetical protein